MKTRTAIVVGVLLFCAGFLLGQYPDRKGRSAKAAEPAAPAVVWSDDITIRKNHDAPTVLRPHHVYTDGQNHAVNSAPESAETVWQVSYGSGRAVVAYTPVK